MLVRVIFTATGGNPILGEFSPGDSARVSAAMAQHLIDAKCAKLAPVAAPEAPAKRKKLTLKGRKC